MLFRKLYRVTSIEKINTFIRHPTNYQIIRNSIFNIKPNNCDTTLSRKKIPYIVYKYRFGIIFPLCPPPHAKSSMMLEILYFFLPFIANIEFSVWERCKEEEHISSNKFIIFQHNVHYCPTCCLVTLIPTHY